MEDKWGSEEREKQPTDQIPPLRSAMSLAQCFQAHWVGFLFCWGSLIHWAINLFFSGENATGTCQRQLYLQVLGEKACHEHTELHIKNHTNCCNRSTNNNLCALPWVHSPFWLQAACAFLPDWTGVFLLSDTSKILTFILKMEQNVQLRSRCPWSFGNTQINRINNSELQNLVIFNSIHSICVCHCAE